MVSELALSILKTLPASPNGVSASDIAETLDEEISAETIYAELTNMELDAALTGHTPDDGRMDKRNGVSLRKWYRTTNGDVAVENLS